MRGERSDEATRLLDRIAAGDHGPEAVERLRQLVSVRGDSNRVQVGRHNIDISGGHDIRIGDHIYQGADADTITAIIREILREEEPPTPSRLYIVVASLGFLLCVVAMGVFGFTLFTDVQEIDPREGLQVPQGIVLAGGLFFAGFVLIVLSNVIRAIANPRAVAQEQQRRRWR